MAQFSGRAVSAGDAGMLVSGVVVGVASFLPWYGWQAGSSYHLQYNAWDNVFPLIAVLLVGITSLLAATRMFDGVRLRAIGPVGPSFLLVLLSAAAVVLIVTGLLTVGEATDPLLRSELVGEARYGLFVGLGASLVQLVFAALAFQASGEGFAGRGREVAPPPVPYGQPYGQQPTPGYWPPVSVGQGQPVNHVQYPYGYNPSVASPSSLAPPPAPPPPPAPSPYARPVAGPASDAWAASGETLPVPGGGVPVLPPPVAPPSSSRPVPPSPPVPLAAPESPSS